MCVHAKSLQSCPALCNPMGYSPPCSSVHWILQARILEWVAMVFPPGDLPSPEIKPTSLMSLALADGSLPLASPKKPICSIWKYK